LSSFIASFLLPFFYEKLMSSNKINLIINSENEMRNYGISVFLLNGFFSNFLSFARNLAP
jgi:hypothetical protein